MRLLRATWTARKSNQSILKEINPEYSLEGLMLKLKLQYFGHLMWRNDSFEKALMLGKTEGRRRGQQKMILLDSITDSMDMNLSKLQEIVKDREAWSAGLHGIAEGLTRLSDWETTTTVPSRRGWWQILLRNVPWNYVSVRVGESPREILNRMCLTEKPVCCKVFPLIQFVCQFSRVWGTFPGEGRVPVWRGLS